MSEQDVRISAHKKEHGTFDLTQLKPSQQEQRVNRDYAAHYFRWGWVKRFIKNMPMPQGYKGSAGYIRLLDVGCGQETPLLRVINTDADSGPRISRYLGVDMNPIPKPPKIGYADTLASFDFTARFMELPDPGSYDIVVATEVIEHMPVEHGWQLLLGAKRMLAPDGCLVLSTPVFNGKKASNHIHEYTVPELAYYIDHAGFTVSHRYGTFASYRDVLQGISEGLVTPDVHALYERLREFYSDDVMGNWLAPVLPDHSRNNMWVLRHKETA